MSAADDALLRLQGVEFRYGARRVLRGVDFQLHAGERVALIGPNGAGKTTLLHLLVGLERPAAGGVFAFGARCCEEADFLPVRARVGLLFQNSDDQLFCPTVLDDVAFGPLNLGRSPTAARRDAEEALANLGLAAFAERVTHRLSAGEKRLVALATVLAMRPRVLLLDEPTTGLDQASAELLITRLSTLRQAMLIVSHDRRFLERLVDRALVLDNGRLHAGVLHRHPHLHRHEHLHLHLPGDTAAHRHGDQPAAPEPLLNPVSNPAPESAPDQVPEHPDHHAGE